MNEWQRGYDLAQLKSYAAVFAARHKPLVFGAFGLVKERDIADALAEKALLYKHDESGRHPVACAIARRLRTAGGFSDFTGAEHTIPAGNVRVSAFAAREVGAGVAMLRALRQRAPGKLWLEAFEEDMIAREALAGVPELAYVATRIAAGSEVKGIYSDAPQPAKAPLHAAERASLVVIEEGFASAAECFGMLAEINGYAALIERQPWAQHYSSYNVRKSWTAFALRGYDPADPSFIIKPVEMAKGWQQRNPERMRAGYDWTVAADHFPATMACVRRILGGRDADRVRLMKLAPGGELSRHADVTNRDAGLSNGRLARLHLPLRTSPAVLLHGWDKRGQHIQTRFPAGALCYLDQRGPHRVENRDQQCERVHLVLDVRADAQLRDMIASANDRLPAVA